MQYVSREGDQYYIYDDYTKTLENLSFEDLYRIRTADPRSLGLPVFIDAKTFGKLTRNTRKGRKTSLWARIKALKKKITIITKRGKKMSDQFETARGYAQLFKSGDRLAKKPTETEQFYHEMFREEHKPDSSFDYAILEDGIWINQDQPTVRATRETIEAKHKALLDKNDDEHHLNFHYVPLSEWLELEGYEKAIKVPDGSGYVCRKVYALLFDEHGRSKVDISPYLVR